jgi:hypothetical protein
LIQVRSEPGSGGMSRRTWGGPLIPTLFNCGEAMTDRERAEKLIAAARRYYWPDDEVIEKEILPIFEEIRQEERDNRAQVLSFRRIRSELRQALGLKRGKNA